MTQLFINEKIDIVNDAIDGALYNNQHNNLTRLALDPSIRIVLRNDWKKDKVALISGGGSGHEPAHLGFVGKGMLTAAVCGDIFASPSVDAVFNAIVHVTGDKGCLVIVKNYTGDRLNFGLACEKAKKMGLKVEMVIVNDDISIPNNPQPRGIAGTLFIHKIAGHEAEQGSDLATVKASALATIDATKSIGLAVTSCSLPGDKSEQRIPYGQAELGLGIHGEPGIDTIDFINCENVVVTMVDKITKSLTDKNTKIALLINNLGGVSPLEMSIISKTVLESSLKNNIALIVGPSLLMTAIDMKGFSLSCVELNDENTNALRSKVEVESWPIATLPRELPILKSNKVSVNFKFTPSKNDAIAQVIRTVTTTLIASEDELNNLDSLVGDGDTGSTFSAGAREVLAQLDKGNLPLDDTSALLNVIGELLSTVMGGSSGVLFSIFFTAAGHHFEKNKDLIAALQSGLQQMMEYGGAAPGDRTMIDAMHPAFITWHKSGLQAAIKAAIQGSEKTATMIEAKAGRSSYLNSESLQGVKDPGSVAVEYVFSAFQH